MELREAAEWLYARLADGNIHQRRIAKSATEFGDHAAALDYISTVILWNAPVAAKRLPATMPRQLGPHGLVISAGIVADTSDQCGSVTVSQRWRDRWRAVIEPRVRSRDLRRILRLIGSDPSWTEPWARPIEHQRSIFDSRPIWSQRSWRSRAASICAASRARDFWRSLRRWMGKRAAISKAMPSLAATAGKAPTPSSSGWPPGGLVDRFWGDSQTVWTKQSKQSTGEPIWRT